MLMMLRGTKKRRQPTRTTLQESRMTFLDARQTADSEPMKVPTRSALASVISSPESWIACTAAPMP